MDASKRRAKSIYLALVERVQPEHWSSYLDVACNEDQELREELESLLAANVPDQFLAQPAAAVIATACPPMPLAKQGDQIGPYRLREQLGEGGMGVVYVAEQTEPVRRKVALKIIRPGLATQDVLARFEVERQALAMMDHPDIARIFDGGQTDAGDPYFVMELVQGPPITEYCDQHGLTTRQRLELFRHICHAVQHAHQKGIIHRDLKPSNILVPRVDGVPVPKVIDFGVAKAVNLGMKLSEQTVYTQFAQMVGTPLYMSPEQTEPGVVDIDTRSDVYSLGVLLYELLTGGTPFDSDMLKQAGFDEMRRIIREEDPPAPSVRVSTLQAEALSTVSERRGCDPRTLRDSLHGELDWLVMKALEKDRNRRYGSPNDLADDLDRYLEGDAIVAHPPSRLYQIRKFTRRHRAAVVTAATICFVLVAGAAGTTWQMVRAMNAEEVAEAATEQSRSEADRAMQSLSLARSVVDTFYLQLGTQWVADETSPTDFQSGILEEAAKFYKELSELPLKPGASPRDLELITSGFDRVGQIQHYLCNYDDAVAAYDKCIEALTNTYDASPRAAIRSQLTHAYYHKGQSLAELARYDDALRSYDQSSRLSEALVQAGVDPVVHRYLLSQLELARAGVLTRAGSLAEARQFAESAKEKMTAVRQDVDQDMTVRETVQFELLRVDLCRARIRAYQGDLDDASQLIDRSLENVEMRRTTDHDNVPTREIQIDFQELAAKTAQLRGDLSGAAEAYRLALDMRRDLLPGKIAPEHFFMESAFKISTNMDGQIQFGPFCEYVEADQRLAKVLHRYGRPYAAENILGECRTVTAVLVAERPNSLRYRVADANTWTLAAELLSHSRPAEASILLQRAREIWLQILQRFPQAKQSVSGVHGIESDWQYFQTVNDHFDELPTRKGESTAEEHDTIFYHHSNGRSWTRIQDWEAAKQAFELSLAKRTNDRAYDWLQLAIVHSELGQQEEAESLMTKARQSILAKGSVNLELNQLVKAVADNLTNTEAE